MHPSHHWDFVGPWYRQHPYQLGRNPTPIARILSWWREVRTFSELFPSSLLHQWFWICRYVWTTFGTIVANCDRPSNCWDPYRRVWEGPCTGNAVWGPVLSFSCWHLAVGDNVKVDFWGMCLVVRSHVFFSHFSASSPSFPATRWFVRHYVLWSSEFSSLSFRSSRLCATISVFSWHSNVRCSPACASCVWSSAT